MEWTRHLGGMALRSQNDFRVRGTHSTRGGESNAAAS
jgi:hypothetical protein